MQDSLYALESAQAAAWRPHTITAREKSEYFEAFILRDSRKQSAAWEKLIEADRGEANTDWASIHARQCRWPGVCATDIPLEGNLEHTLFAKGCTLGAFSIVENKGN
jgi:hypothetical protein